MISRFLCLNAFPRTILSKIFISLMLASSCLIGGQVRAVDANAPIELGRDIAKLPEPVRRMRQAILQAATSGDIAQLRLPIDMNEIHPIFSKDRVADPIAYLKSIASDANGRETLAILFNVLTSGYAVIRPGTKEEMIVWPYHAAIKMNAMTPSQEVEIYRFVSPNLVKDMIAANKYAFYSVGIGHDGVWHYFSKDQSLH